MYQAGAVDNRTGSHLLIISSRDTMMTEQENSDGTALTRAGILIALLCGLPLFYILSVGPAAWLVAKHPSLDAPLSSFYAPIIWLANKLVGE